MSCIVTCKPPHRRKPVALEIPVIITAKKPGRRPKPPTPANDDRKSAIITTISRRRARFLAWARAHPASEEATIARFTVLIGGRLEHP